ncbi:hypothetical protein OC846_000270 [Tilletia horrida]|uniref:Mitochondrial adapter protein MCP1 transmembrane domain-containing protein n=1 Tax=Tilletia horrida TaxID=155126 RepID=A0AAN6GW41_9BASI|nr:hypothetical protein OC846_000270 [Tilletia horrida]KAK0570323.1 hypothetical protein OC861_000066 [Tilletia horrida]
MSASTSSSSSAAASRKRRSQVLRSLSQAQQVSALAFGSFLTVHIAAPALALLAPPGSSHDVATGTMLLGRVWYQNPASEPALVWGALTVHLLSGLARKAIIVLWEPPLAEDDDGDAALGKSGEASGSSTTSTERRKRKRRTLAQRVAALPSDWQTISGALLVPFTLHHAYLNRVVPARSSYPITNLSPSELDYTYVAHGFSHTLIPRAIVSTAAYTALIGLSVFHTCKGLQKMVRWRSLASKTQENSKAPAADELGPSSSVSSALSDSGSSEISKADSVIQRRLLRQRRNRQWDAAAGITTALICGGLLRLVRETDSTPAFLAKRYEACYTLVWPYSRI